MPYAWVEPPVFTKGIPGTYTIYHAYDDNDADGHLMQYWYGVDPGLGEILYFDVRDLPRTKVRLVSVGDVIYINPEERQPHARRIFSAMRDSEFSFRDWLEEHGTPEGEL